MKTCADFHTTVKAPTLEGKTIESITLAYTKALIQFTDGTAAAIDTCDCCGLGLELDP